MAKITIHNGTTDRNNPLARAAACGRAHAYNARAKRCAVVDGTFFRNFNDLADTRTHNAKNPPLWLFLSLFKDLATTPKMWAD